MILVTGARGNIGRHVMEGLVSRGQSVRAMSRTIEPADVAIGVEAVQVDHSDSVGVKRAMIGVEKVFLLLPPAGMLQITQRFVDCANRCGVAHIVMITSLSIEKWEHLSMGRELSVRTTRELFRNPLDIYTPW